MSRLSTRPEYTRRVATRGLSLTGYPSWNRAYSGSRPTLGIVCQDGSYRELLERCTHDGWISNGHDLQLLGSDEGACGVQNSRGRYRLNAVPVLIEVIVRQPVRHEACECVRNCSGRLESDRKNAVEIARREGELVVSHAGVSQSVYLEHDLVHSSVCDIAANCWCDGERPGTPPPVER